MRIRLHHVLQTALGFCFFLPLLGAGQIVNPTAVTFINAESVAALDVQAVFAVQAGQVRKEGGHNWFPVGSGFFEANGTNEVLLGVTCNHVINAAERFVSAPGFDRQIYVGLNTQDGYQRFPCRVIYRNSSNDVAVVSIQKEASKVVRVKNAEAPPNMFDDGSSLVLGRGVLIIGYPLSIGAAGDQNHPVVRFGMIAQNSGYNTFLIDGMASHGNSGSPVFALTPDKQPLIGMVTSFESDKITLLDENGGLSAQLPYNSGLAGAVKASVILNAIKEARKNL